MFLVIPIAAVVPGLLLLTYFNACQRYHLSAGIVWSSVLLGASVAVLTISIELPLDFVIAGIQDPYVNGVTRALIGTAAPEEVCKFLIVYWIALRHEDYERPVDALVLAVAVSLGFATFENLLYLVNSDDWSRTAAARAMTAVPSHVINAMFMGYFLGRAQLSPARAPLYRTLAVAAPVLNHGAYDVPLFVIDALNRDPLTNTDALTLPLILLFAVIIGVGSLLALAAWYDLLHRDSAEAARGEARFVVRRLPAWLEQAEAPFWLLVGTALAMVSLGAGVASFVAPLESGPRWAAFYPEYFMLASSILPGLFGCAMFGHGVEQLRKRA